MTVVPSRRPACGKQFALSFRFVKGEPTVGNHEGGNPRDGGNYNGPRFLRAARVDAKANPAFHHPLMQLTRKAGKQNWRSSLGYLQRECSIKGACGKH